MSSPQHSSFPLPASCLTVQPPANRLKHQSTSRHHLQEPGTPRTRSAKNQVHQEPVGLSRTSRNNQTVTNCRCCCHQSSGAIRSCQEPSPTVIRISHQLPSGQSCRPFIGDQCGRSLKHDFSQIQLAYWRIPARDLQPSILVFILSRISNEMQLPINTGLAHNAMFGALNKRQKATFAGTTERKHDAPTERQRATITSQFSPT